MLSDARADFAAIEVDIADGTALVSLRGDMDASMASALADLLAGLGNKKPGRLIFDMATVGYLDCATAGVMFRAARSMLAGGKPVIRSAGPLVRRLLELTGLDTQCELAG